ncbi:MAG: hemolytic protein HlpA [Candidatus Parcubacteria bacterium]|nr:MAG: hemolytic protein HlpA [Candidatus Pacearchaeota archaeon]GIW65359.1 MAG: hemolytic protein HlpA [Candidatus Parcubacteria bacterium]
MKKQLKTPVLLLTFKRPETTKLVFEEIRKAKPKELFLFSDGPKNELERKKVEEVRKIISKVDWPCKVKKRFLKKNGGFIGGVLGAIKWFFKHVPEGIILEDDGLPNQDFFRFCSELLERYRDDDRIMHINGCNFQRGWTSKKSKNYSYYFSIFPHTYGWAMWAKKRKKYYDNMKEYLEFRKKIKVLFPGILERIYIKRIMDNAYYKNSNAIDTKWFFSIVKNNGLCIVPNKNLVRGIGFSENATNTKFDYFLSLPTEKIDFPLKHPPFVIRDRKADERYIKWLLKNRIKKRLFLR